MMVVHPAPANPPLLPGVTDAVTLFRAIVEHPDKVRDFLGQWRTYLERYEAVIANYGGTQKIGALLAENEAANAAANKANAAAQEALRLARLEADQIVASAKASVARQQAALANKADELDADMAAIRRERQDMESQLAAREKAAAGREGELAQRMAAVEAREGVVNAQIEKMKAAGIKIEL